MNRTAIAAVAASILLGSTAALAQTARLTFVAVDAVRLDSQTSDLYVTGVVEGASASAEVHFRRASTAGPDLAECRRYALLAMSKPGQYRLSFNATAPATITYLYDCKLERASP